MRQTLRRSRSRWAMACVFCLAPALASQARAAGSRSVSVALPFSPEARSERLSELARKFDVAGVDKESNRAILLVADDELDPLLEKSGEVRIEPQVSNGISGYRDGDAVVRQLERWASENPTRARTFVAGRSHEGRPLVGIEISANLGNKALPAVLLNGAHHAREVMTVEVVLDAAQELLEGYGHDAEITRWLDTTRILLVPVVNPDGYARVFQGSSGWRKNAWSDAGKVWGVDPNRNYPAFWNACNGSSGNKSSDSYRGPAAGSEPEVQALMKLVRDERPVADLSYHAFSELIIFPFSCASVENPSRALFQEIGEGMRRGIADDRGRLGTYEVGTAPEVIYAADGTDIDWMWREEGVLALALEVNSSQTGFQPSYSQWRDLTVSRQREGWKSVLRRVHGGGVKALVQKSGDLATITYEVLKVTKDDKTPWASPEMAPFRLRSKEGHLFQLLQNGNYMIRFSQSGHLLRSVEFRVDGETADLGTISLEE